MWSIIRSFGEKKYAQLFIWPVLKFWQIPILTNSNSDKFWFRQIPILTIPISSKSGKKRILTNSNSDKFRYPLHYNVTTDSFFVFNHRHTQNSGTISCPTLRAGSLPNIWGMESGRHFFPMFINVFISRFLSAVVPISSEDRLIESRPWKLWPNSLEVSSFWYSLFSLRRMM